MKKLNGKNINNLPFHDSKFSRITFSQNNKGTTDLILDINFCEGEFENITEYSSIIRADGSASLLFTDCYLINCKFISNVTQRDSIDFIKILDNASIPKDFKGQNQFEVMLNSGSKIECIAKSISLIKTKT
ncbi:MAG: hypothetical protein GY797_05455 [Deltaproteobacteria bacterium]|nr:hypothetical protein [Deltaproteobacteria bacterium]